MVSKRSPACGVRCSGVCACAAGNWCDVCCSGACATGTRLLSDVWRSGACATGTRLLRHPSTAPERHSVRPGVGE